MSNIKVIMVDGGGLGGLPQCTLNYFLNENEWVLGRVPENTHPKDDIEEH